MLPIDGIQCFIWCKAWPSKREHLALLWAPSKYDGKPVRKKIWSHFSCPLSSWAGEICSAEADPNGGVQTVKGTLLEAVNDHSNGVHCEALFFLLQQCLMFAINHKGGKVLRIWDLEMIKVSVFSAIRIFLSVAFFFLVKGLHFLLYVHYCVFIK